MKAPSVPTRAVVAGLFALTLLSSSCGDPTSSPNRIRAPEAEVETSASLIGWLLDQLNLLSCTPLPYAQTTQTVGSGGGTINVGPHKLVIPAGALSGNVTITATAPSVPRREVQFEPHGLQFEEKATLTLSYAQCSLVAQLIPKKVVYVDGNLNILELLWSLDNFFLKKVSGKLDHFSGYAVAY
jgi:hypothetical protein